VTSAARIGLAVAVSVLTVWTLLIPRLVTASYSHHGTAGLLLSARAGHLSPVDGLGSGRSDPDDDEADGTVDLYGNEVTDAVAKYKLDAAGALYELHSPQTEVPRLGSPKS
jgi:hypothetical protein